MSDDLLTTNKLTIENKITYGSLIVFIGYLLCAIALFYSARDPIRRFVNNNVKTWNEIMKVRP